MPISAKPDLALVLEHYGVTVIDRHGWVPCKCVIHDDTHSSAAYNLDNQAYNCLVCQVLGDVYTLVQAKEGLDFKDAKRKAEAITFAPRSCPSKPTFAMSTRKGLAVFMLLMLKCRTKLMFPTHVYGIKGHSTVKTVPPS